MRQNASQSKIHYQHVINSMQADSDDTATSNCFTSNSVYSQTVMKALNASQARMLIPYLTGTQNSHIISIGKNEKKTRVLKAKIPRVQHRTEIFDDELDALRKRFSLS